MVKATELEEFKLQIIKARKSILDLLEVSLTDQQWGILRGKVMTVFGRDGLEGRISELVNSASKESSARHGDNHVSRPK